MPFGRFAAATGTIGKSITALHDERVWGGVAGVDVVLVVDAVEVVVAVVLELKLELVVDTSRLLEVVTADVVVAALPDTLAPAIDVPSADPPPHPAHRIAVAMIVDTAP